MEFEFDRNNMGCDYYVCDTPNGADWTTCPMCNGDNTLYMDFKLKEGRDETSIHNLNHYSDCDYTDDEDERDDVDGGRTIYCIDCKIIFRVGGYYIERGCTDSTYYAEMVSSFKVGDQEIKGIPRFKSHKQWKRLLRNKKLTLKWSKSPVKKRNPSPEIVDVVVNVVVNCDK
jgi:hypothetical protein